MKKLISTILLVAILVSVFVSCATTKAEDGLTSDTIAPDNTISSVDTTTEASTTEAAEYVKPE
jgi:PBP1b-binding outer membrane lipoprotein LpoB